VNLMGDHTDYVGGLVLPMAIQLGTTVEGEPGGERLQLWSEWSGDGLDAALPDLLAPDAVANQATPWARLVAAVAAEVRPVHGFDGRITTTLPVGGGLSSSAAFVLAVALALGFDGEPRELAALGRGAERAGTGVPCGIMDQLASACGVAGHALRIDCTEGSARPTPIADGLQVLVVHSGVERHLDRVPYAERVAETTAALELDGDRRGDPLLHRRRRHLRSENERVDQLAAALATDDRATIAELLAASHASLRDDAEVSLPVVDDLVDRLHRSAGVIGARLTGAGFGGCVVAILDRGAPLPDVGDRWWRVEPSGGATCAEGGRPSWPRTRPG
jgi:galactokinase